jgi:Glycosyl hydrolases family 16
MAESPDKTTVLPPTFIVDANGSLWSLSPSVSHGMMVTYNGVVDATTSQVVQLYYLKHQVYQENNAGQWWVWQPPAWVACPDPTTAPPTPTPTPTPPTPTPTPTPPPTTESKDGTTITTVGPAIINSIGESWTLMNTGANPMQVGVNGVPDTTTASVVMLYYSGHKVYQSNKAGGWWSKTTSKDSWVATSDPRSGTGTSGKPPPQAVNAGYTNLVFNDDFTNTSTIATSQYATQGFYWYWAQRYGKPASPSEWVVNTTATAASISNGNSGGGNNASTSGGILQIKTGNFPNANIISVPGWAMNNGMTPLPAMGKGHWKHCYMEAYIQYIPDQNASVNYQQTGWPAYWSWAAEGIGDYGFPGSGLHCPNTIEVDFLEQFGNAKWDDGSSSQKTQWSAGLINHGGGGGGGLGGGHIDSNWHTYGFLWTPGKVSIWFDNVQQSNMTLQSGATALDQQSLFITIGTGPNWQMNIDWVRVWQ